MIDSMYQIPIIRGFGELRRVLGVPQWRIGSVFFHARSVREYGHMPLSFPAQRFPDWSRAAIRG